MDVIYHFGLSLFKILLVALSPFNSKAKMWLQGRRGIYEHIQSKLSNQEQRIWIHAASLGEFEQGRPVIEALKKNFPDLKIVLTFFSPSGYEIQKDYEHADYVFYLPLDTKRNAKKFVNLIQPDFVIFVKYEFWRNYLTTLKQKQIPTYLISAIFRQNQVFFRPYGKWYRKMLKAFQYFFVQNQESKDLLGKLGFENTIVSGDTRFDRVYDIASQLKTNKLIEKFTQDKFVVILGSSWKADEEILFDYMNKAGRGIRYIIAPHEIHESNIQRILENLNKKAVRYSKADESSISEAEILIIDNIGMLSSIYQYGKIAYIGGGFGSGIHNVLEATTFGLPVLFGPNYKKFQEAIDLIQLGGAFEINNKQELEDKLNRLYIDNMYLEAVSIIAKQYVENKQGATKLITEFITEKHLIVS